MSTCLMLLHSYLTFILPTVSVRQLGVGRELIVLGLVPDLALETYLLGNKLFTLSKVMDHSMDSNHLPAQARQLISMYSESGRLDGFGGEPQKLSQ